MSKKTIGIEEVVTGDVTGWRGLPAQIGLRSVVVALSPVEDLREPREATRTYRRCWHSDIRRASPPSPVEVWEEWDHSTVFLIEWDDPPVANLDGTLRELGFPELILKDRRVAIGMTVEEHVYAERGLTLSIGDPYPGSEEKRRRCTHLQLYQNISLQRFLTEIGTGPDISPHPP
ncbi:MAG: hypothetical protein ACHQ50_02735 [Fimbriimonadales bacterium]